MYSQIRSNEQDIDMIFTAIMAGLYFIRPGIVLDFNSDKNTVDAMIAVKRKITRGENIEYIDMPVVPDIPIVVPYDQLTGLALTIPIRAQSKCVLLFSDRFIEEFIRTGQSAHPEVLLSDNRKTIPRSHNMADAICLPGLITAADALPDWNNDAIEMRDRAREKYISLSNDGIIMTDGQATHTISGGVVRTVAPNGYYVDAPNWRADNSGAYVNGIVRGTDVETTAGFSANQHRHSGVEQGGGTSGTFV